MEFDYSKLRGRMVEMFGSTSAVAEKIGMSKAAMSSRLNNATPFKDSEIFSLCATDCLDIPDSEIVAYFFTPKVR